MFFLVLLLSLAGNSGHLTWVRYSSFKSSATHSYQLLRRADSGSSRQNCSFRFSTSLSLAGNSGRLTWVRYSSFKSSATHSYQLLRRADSGSSRQNCSFRFSTSLSLAGNSGRLTWVRHSSRKSSATHSYLAVCAVFSCVQTMVWLPVLGIFNVRVDVAACDCTLGLYGHRKRVGTEN